MKLDPPIQLFGHTIFSVQGLIQYAVYYSEQWSKLLLGIDRVVNEKCAKIINDYDNKRSKLVKGDDYWKKQFFKLKNRALTKYDVFYNDETGVKILIPRNAPKGETKSPKNNLETLQRQCDLIRHTLEYKMFKQEAIESRYTEFDGYSFKDIKNPFRIFKSKKEDLVKRR